MFISLFRIWLIVFMMLITQLVFAQSNDYIINNGRQRTTFNFELVNNLIVVPVTLNNNLELKFILDTGVRSTLLTEKSEHFSSLATSQQVQISGAGQNRKINAYVVEDVKISLPGITGQGQTLVVLQEDYLQLSAHLGKEVHGIIGYDFFNSFVVEINYTGKRITVYQRDAFKPGRRTTAVPINVEQGRPYIEASVNPYNHDEFDARLLIDSGASHGLLLELDSDERIMLPDSVLSTIIGWGLGGELPGYLGRIEAVKLGEFRFEDMLTSFAEGYSDQRLFELLGRRGSIGGELLSRFTTIYDYHEQVLYLRKNYHIKREFEFNLSGIDLIAEGAHFKTFRVIHVIAGSPADQAGVKPNDIILRANGQYAGQLTLSDLNSMMRLRPGRRIDLLIVRDNDFMPIQFRLRRLI